MNSDSVTVREFGERLKQARLGQSRSLDELAAQTRIHRRHLEAIESGDLSRLPEGPYAKAFIREYARALGLAVPPEFAAPVAGPSPNAKDPKVVSRPIAGESAESDSMLPISAVAKETVRFANTAVSSAVKSVAKTTEKMVDFVESGSKEAIEVLTSKTLWDEADQVRRERLGLAPIEPDPAIDLRHHKVVPEPEPVEPPPPPSKLQASLAPISYVSSDDAYASEKRVSSRGATNVIIALLVLLFAGAVFYAIRTYKRESAPVANSKDYVPAPLDKPAVLPSTKRPAPAATEPVAATPVVGPHDSLIFQIRATSPVWVSIAPDGVPAYRGELKAGETRSFRAGERFQVNIGNQKSVAMSLDGRPIANLPTIPNSGVVIRDLVLTRDHAQIGGKTIDLHAPVSTPAVTTPNVASPKPTSAQPQKSATTSTKTPSASTNTVKSPAKVNAMPPKAKLPPASGTDSMKKTSGISKSTRKSASFPPIPPLKPVPGRQ